LRGEDRLQGERPGIDDRTHGVQSKASFLKAIASTTVEGIEKYLRSGMIRGIGPVYAKKLVRAFGETAKPYSRSSSRSRIACARHRNGVGTSRAVRIYKTYGADAEPGRDQVRRAEADAADVADQPKWVL
jgi:exodeoxyribonuclease V alpha subunit